VLADFALTEQATERLVADWWPANPERELLWPSYGRAPAVVRELVFADREARSGAVEGYRKDRGRAERETDIENAVLTFHDREKSVGARPTDFSQNARSGLDVRDGPAARSGPGHPALRSVAQNCSNDCYAADGLPDPLRPNSGTTAPFRVTRCDGA